MMRGLTTELCEAVVLQLPPRHVYQLMQTNKRLYKCCLSAAYWTRVAAQLLWAEAPSSRDMVLMDKSYCDAMDDTIQAMRIQILVGYERSDLAHQPLEAILPWLQTFGNRLWGARPVIPGESAFELTKRYVKDSDHLPLAIQRSTRGWDVPVTTGFITRRRRAARATSTFLRSLEDDPGMDVQTKRRVRDYARRLLHDITENRGVLRFGNFMTCELQEAHISASDISL
jgi:hypothetical protein